MHGRNSRNGGGGRTSSPPLVVGAGTLKAVSVLFGLSATSIENWRGALWSSWRSKFVFSGGALCDLVGRCRGRVRWVFDFQVFIGGERREVSTFLGDRSLLVDLLADWSASESSGSVSDSRVTIIGRLTGWVFALPNANPGRCVGYRGMGDTRTVRSVMVVVVSRGKMQN